MSPSEYEKLTKLCNEREAAWRQPPRVSGANMFNKPVYTLQAAIVWIGLILVLAYEAGKWIWEGMTG